MKLQARFFMSHGLAVLVAAGAGLAVLYVGARSLLEREALEHRRQTVEALATVVQETLVRHEVEEAIASLRTLTADPMVAFAACGWTGGPSMALPATARGLAMAGPPVAGAPTADGHQRAGDVELWTRHVGGEGWLRLGWREDLLEDEIDEKLGRWMALSSVAAVAALTLGLLLALLLAKNLVAPLKAITEGTREVRAGRLDTLVQVARDDEIGDLARDFNAMTQQLKELDAMKRDFVAGVTHDLGTPLYAIRSAAEFLIKDQAAHLERGGVEYLMMISNSAIQLSSFVDNLLTTARIEAGKQEAFFERFDAWEIVEECVGLYAIRARESNVLLTARCEAPTTFAVGDQGMFRQMVMNLVSNAVKFTPNGSVDVALSRTKERLVLTVKDTGIGIAPLHQELIFDRFFRVRQPKGTPIRQGSGLGLAIVRALAAVQQGEIRVHSDLGKGAVFELLLPDQPLSLVERPRV